MIYSILADIVVFVHFVFILLVVAGGLAVAFRPRLAFIHLPIALWGALISLFGWICPLTPLENNLRFLAGQEGYSGGFIEHYLTPVIYPDGLTRTAQIVMGVFVVAVNAFCYRWAWRRWKKREKTQIRNPND